ncbi:unnamed protein product [Linum trigynum]|uniref:Uncharacterized protein n=1 Tax=Linum trigynum TaxID=586398 RepID=A0AAV2E6J5_9ROSI
MQAVVEVDMGQVLVHSSPNQVAEVVMGQNEILSNPNQVRSPPLSFAHVVRGSPNAGSPVTTEQLTRSLESPLLNDVSSRVESDQGGIEGGLAIVSKEVHTLQVDKGKNIWVEDSHEAFQVAKRGGKGGKGKKRMK